MIFSFSSQVILHAGLYRSFRIHISKIKGKPSPSGRRCPAGQVRGSVKVFFPGHHLFLLTDPPLLEGVGSFMTVDSATSPSASRRMTGGGRHPMKMEGLGLEEPTKWEFGVMGIGFF